MALTENFGHPKGFPGRLMLVSISMDFDRFLIDTTNGKWIRKSEAGWMGLSGSALLTGRK